MPVFQFKCEACLSVCEYFISPFYKIQADCVSCGSEKVTSTANTYFYPNKVFCPHDKDLDAESLQSELPKIMQNTELKCGGCGTDGAPGKCSSGGGCGSGGCGKGGCGGGGCGKKSSA